MHSLETNGLPLGAKNVISFYAHKHIILVYFTNPVFSVNSFLVQLREMRKMLQRINLHSSLGLFGSQLVSPLTYSVVTRRG